MLIYLLCGVFLGALIGSWGVWILTHIEQKPTVAVTPPVEPEELTPEEIAEEIKAKRDMQKLEQSLYEMLMHGGRKINVGGEDK